MSAELVNLQNWPDRFWVRAALIQNLSGQLAGVSGDSNSLTNRLDRDHLIALRNSADLVIVGAQTIRAEDPPAPTANYWIVSNTREFSKPPRAANSANTSLISTQLDPVIPTIVLPEITPAALVELAKATGYARILIEGGVMLIKQFIAAGLLDEAIITVVDRPGTGEIMHRAKFGLSLRTQVNLAGLKFQSWLREDAK